jgi:hypothetical protein
VKRGVTSSDISEALSSSMFSTVLSSWTSHLDLSDVWKTLSQSHNGFSYTCEIQTKQEMAFLWTHFTIIYILCCIQNLVIYYTNNMWIHNMQWQCFFPFRTSG